MNVFCGTASKLSGCFGQCYQSINAKLGASIFCVGRPDVRVENRRKNAALGLHLASSFEENACAWLSDNARLLIICTTEAQPFSFPILKLRAGFYSLLYTWAWRKSLRTGLSSMHGPGAIGLVHRFEVVSFLGAF